MKLITLNNKIKRIFIFSILSFFILSSITAERTLADGEIAGGSTYDNSSGPIEDHSDDSGGGDSAGLYDSSYHVIGAGYRVTLVYSELGAEASRAGEAVDGTHSYDVWQPHTKDSSGYAYYGSGDGRKKYYEIDWDENKVNVCQAPNNKQHKQAVNSCSWVEGSYTVPHLAYGSRTIGNEPIAEDPELDAEHWYFLYFFPGNNDEDRCDEDTSGNSDCAHRRGNYFADSMASLLDKEVKVPNAASYPKIEAFLNAVGYNGTVSSAAAAGYVLQIEPLSIIQNIRKVCNNYDSANKKCLGSFQDTDLTGKVFLGTSTQLAAMGAYYKDGQNNFTWHFKTFTNSYPIIYSRYVADSSGNMITKLANIDLCDPSKQNKFYNGKVNMTIDGTKQATSCEAISIYYLGQLKDNCTTKVQQALAVWETDRNDAAYTQTINQIKSTDPDCQKTGWCQEIDLNSVRNLGLTKNTIACEPKQCGEDALNIYHKCHSGTCSPDSGTDLAGKTYDEALEYLYNKYPAQCGSNGEGCNRMDEVAISAFGPPTEDNACSNVPCQSQATAIFNLSIPEAEQTRLLNELYYQQNNFGNSYPLLLNRGWEAAGMSEPVCASNPPCSPSLTTDNCSTGTIEFKDSNDETQCWNNPVDTSSFGYTINSSGPSSIDDVFTSDICTVKCREEVIFDFPTDTIASQVMAGTKFIWGTGGSDPTVETFGTMTINRTCKSKYNSGYTDPVNLYDTNETALKEAFDKYKLYKNAYNSISSTNTSSCTYYTDEQDYASSPNHTALGTTHQESHSDGTEASITVNGTTYTSDCYAPDASNPASTQALNDLKGKISTIYEGYEDTYDEKLAVRNALLNGDGICNSNKISEKWADSDHIKTTIELTYEEPTQSSLNANNVLLDAAQVGSPDATAYLKNGSSADASSSAQCQVYTGREEHVCNKSTLTCTTEHVDLYKCDNVDHWDITSTYEYNYTDELMWSSNKADASIVKTKTVNSSDSAFYYDIGYGLPTAFTTPIGIYGGTGSGKLFVKVSNVGTFSGGKAHFDKIIEDGFNGDYGNGTSYFTYSCNFRIKNELFSDECEYDSSGNLISGSPADCDPKEDGNPEGTPTDIDVVFRTIQLVNNTDSSTLANDLDYAFPGMLGTIDGSPRTFIGSNWSSLSDDDKGEILDSTKVSVGAGQGQYELELTPAIIQDIRKMNSDARTQGADPYTNLDMIYTDSETGKGYTGYLCINRSGVKYCASSFLSYLIDNHILEGRCAGDERATVRANNNIGGC